MKFQVTLFFVIFLNTKILTGAEDTTTNSQLLTVEKLKKDVLETAPFSGQYFSVRTDISHSLLDRFPELTTLLTKITTVVKRQSTTPTIVEETAKTDNKNSKISPVQTDNPKFVLDYKPSTSFFHPRPIEEGKPIPPGTPWPDSIAGYKTTLRSPQSTTQNSYSSVTTSKILNFDSINLENRFGSSSSTTTTRSILDYKPLQSSFHPRPFVQGKPIPPGTPWPDSISGYSTTLRNPSSPIVIKSAITKNSSPTSTEINFKNEQPSTLTSSTVTNFPPFFTFGPDVFPVISNKPFSSPNILESKPVFGSDSKFLSTLSITDQKHRLIPKSPIIRLK